MLRKKILFYIDSPGELAFFTATAQALFKRLDVEIVVMLVDGRTHFNENLTQFEIYDYSVLFQPVDEIEPIWLPLHLRHKKRIQPHESYTGLRYARFAFGIWRRRKIRALKRPVKRLRARIRYNRFAFGIWRRRKIRALKRPVKRLRARKWYNRFAFGIWRRRKIRALKRPVKRLRARKWEKLKNMTNIQYRLFKKYWVKPLFRPLLIMLAIIFMPVLGLLSIFRKMRQGFSKFYYWYKTKKSINGFLGLVRPDIIILSEDNIETFSHLFVAQGRNRKIPSLLLPTTIPNPLEPAQFYWDNPNYEYKDTRLQRLIPEKWRFDHRGKTLLRLSPPRILALEYMKLSSPAPWILNYGQAAAIALDSEMQRKTYLDLNFPARQLVVIGDMNGEQLYLGQQNKRKRIEDICARHKLDISKPLVLCAFPPDQYQGSSTSQFEFPSFNAMVKAWMDSFGLLGEGVNVLISPHPRLNPKKLEKFAPGNVTVLDVPTIELVPLCDLYIASISATIRWSIACGIPAINYDCYRYKYGDYKDAPGVLEVDDLNSFRDLLPKFLNDKGFADSVKQKQETVMHDWGIVDDQCPKRLADLVGSVMEQPYKAKPKKNILPRQGINGKVL